MSNGVAIDWAKAKRIALVVPGDSQIDDEFWRLLAPYAIPLVTRTAGAEPSQMVNVGAAASHTKSLAESSDIEVAADHLRTVQADAAAYVDTSISFIRGPGGDLDISRRIESFLNIPTISTSTAVIDACKALEVANLGVLTVYVDEVNDAIPRFFEPQGVTVKRMQKADTRQESGNTNHELGQMSADELVTLGDRMNDADLDAIFIPCTAVRTLDAIEPLEAVIGKPVITAIQATMWRVARLAGLTHDPAQGGRLFEADASD